MNQKPSDNRLFPVLTWHGCYDGNWRGLITLESFRHPAKFAPGLIDRIYRHGFAEGWWKRGDTIGDPFGGIGGGGIFAGYHCLNWIGVELEEPFVALGNANLAIHGPKWMAMEGASRVVLLQGDSRHFASTVSADAILTSPPYADNQRSNSGITRRTPRISAREGLFPYQRMLRKIRWANRLDAVVTSPPYADGLGHGGGRPIHRPGRPDKITLQGQKDGYRQSPGQIQALPSGSVDAVVTSPPFGERTDGCGIAKSGDTLTRPIGQSSRPRALDSTGQIESLASGSIDAVVTSPPWEAEGVGGLRKEKFKDPAAFAANMSAADGKAGRHASSTKSRLAQMERDKDRTYGESDGQIGIVSGETYWTAMAQVYNQCLLSLKPGGVMYVVVKDYVKNKARVPLCDQTLQLLIHLGFEPICRIHATLVKETRTPSLFEDEHVTRKSRKSFFRRLAEKNGSPAIDWEEVLVVRRP